MAVRRALSRLKQQLVIERDSTTELRLAEGLQKGITFRRRVPRPRGVRAMLRRMAKSAGQRGLVFRSSQTAQEYSRVLQENLPAVEDEVEGFFAGYHEVRYGTKQLTVKEEKDLLGLGARILAEIEATKKGE